VNNFEAKKPIQASCIIWLTVYLLIRTFAHNNSSRVRLYFWADTQTHNTVGFIDWYMRLWDRGKHLKIPLGGNWKFVLCVSLRGNGVRNIIKVERQRVRWKRKYTRETEIFKKKGIHKNDKYRQIERREIKGWSQNLKDKKKDWSAGFTGLKKQFLLHRDSFSIFFPFPPSFKTYKPFHGKFIGRILQNVNRMKHKTGKCFTPSLSNRAADYRL
jgi:hypothetical protein